MKQLAAAVLATTLLGGCVFNLSQITPYGTISVGGNTYTIFVQQQLVQDFEGQEYRISNYTVNVNGIRVTCRVQREVRQTFGGAVAVETGGENAVTDACIEAVQRELDRQSQADNSDRPNETERSAPPTQPDPSEPPEEEYTPPEEEYTPPEEDTPPEEGPDPEPPVEDPS